MAYLAFKTDPSKKQMGQQLEEVNISEINNSNRDSVFYCRGQDCGARVSARAINSKLRAPHFRLVQGHHSENCEENRHKMELKKQVRSDIKNKTVSFYIQDLDIWPVTETNKKSAKPKGINSKKSSLPHPGISYLFELVRISEVENSLELKFNGKTLKYHDFAVCLDNKEEVDRARSKVDSNNKTPIICAYGVLKHFNDKGFINGKFGAVQLTGEAQPYAREAVKKKTSSLGYVAVGRLLFKPGDKVPYISVGHRHHIKIDEIS